MKNNTELNKQKQAELLAKAKPFIDSLPKEVFEKIRKRKVIAERGKAIVKLRDKFNLSFPWIGRILKQDHTTVMYRYQKLTGYKPKKYVFGKIKPKPKFRRINENFNNHLFNRQGDYKVNAGVEFMPAVATLPATKFNVGKSYAEYQAEAKERWKKKQILYHKNQLSKLSK